VSIVVVVDDDASARHAISQMLRLRGFEVQAFASAEEALGWRGMAEAACVVTDVKMPGIGGEELLARLRRHPDAPPVIMVTGHGDVAMAVRCLKAGAFDFVEKPFDDDVLVAYVGKAAEQSRLSREAGELRRRLSALEPCEDGCYGMVGRSRPMQEVYAQIAQAARSDAPVLVTGETGTGKELVARAIHSQSARSQGPFVPVNAGALPETMLESELFGHARGAFTGAVTERDGKLVLASGGTLLLDEIEAISGRAQVQLLRVLDDGIIEALGSDRPRQVDVRLLTASNADLEAEVRSGAIREDFYHRIMVLSIHLPPLRDRREDIPMLVAHFLGKAAARAGRPAPSLPVSTLEQLVAYGWPGNVRELKNAVERMAITARGGEAGAFAPDLRNPAEAPRAMTLPAGNGSLRDELERVERQAIEQALREHHGDLAATWRALGISRRGLYERMRRYGLERTDYRG
jgi:two-component system C4-dicarboxylate transport response regulator DctD